VPDADRVADLVEKLGFLRRRRKVDCDDARRVALVNRRALG